MISLLCVMVSMFVVGLCMYQGSYGYAAFNFTAAVLNAYFVLEKMGIFA